MGAVVRGRPARRRRPHDPAGPGRAASPRAEAHPASDRAAGADPAGTSASAGRARRRSRSGGAQVRLAGALAALARAWRRCGRAPWRRPRSARRARRPCARRPWPRPSRAPWRQAGRRLWRPSRRGLGRCCAALAALAAALAALAGAFAALAGPWRPWPGLGGLGAAAGGLGRRPAPPTSADSCVDHGLRRARDAGACGHGARAGVGVDLLGAADDVLEALSGAELRDARLLQADGLAGRRVARGAGGAVDRLEDAEAGDADLLALGDGARDGVDDRLDRRAGRPAVAEPRGDDLDQVGLVHGMSLRRTGEAVCLLRRP